MAVFLRCSLWARLDLVARRSSVRSGPSVRSGSSRSSWWSRSRRSSTASRGAGDRGQAVPLLLGVLAAGMVFLIALTRVGVAAVDAAKARTAADAAALAGARDGQGAATAVAVENGGRLVAFGQVGEDVVVTVRVGQAAAKARARLLVVATRGP
jgi:hypothetical protein